MALLCSAVGHASAATGLTDDAHVSLLTRNFYFDRDYHDSGAQQSQRQEWAQGFIFKASSGYTPGTLGVGLDVLGLLGVKLDSSPDHTGSELLPYDHDDGRAPDTFGRLSATLKLRLSQTELRVGELLPTLPILRYNDGRLLPQTFQGGMLTSREWDGLALHAGQIRSFGPRSAADSEDLYVSVGGRTMVMLALTASTIWEPNTPSTTTLKSEPGPPTWKMSTARIITALNTSGASVTGC